ncbi:MAG TPA: protein kinase [Kofleriaceae bacterium]|nr:protein kinase [Kofleriaceae bacterium]
MTSLAAEDRDQVGPYRVLRAIGAGGSARIDLARIDRAYGFQRHVVIKRPLEHLRGNANVAASLRREARIGGRLHHPNLVAVLDAGAHDGYDYLILEYVHGASLRTLMHGEVAGEVRALPVAVALAIITDVARGMHEAHELTDEHGAPLGLVHRDVSPGNILLGLDGTVKLADFGIAKETRVSTLSGSLHGTVTYMAPEQCQGHAFDRRADVFSLGVILYELITGTRLFWADNDVASLHRVLSGTVPRPREVRPELPEALEAILLTAVAHAPDQRYPTAHALAEAIEGYAAGEVLGARWVARAMEELVGPRQVPWIAAATVPDAAPRRDGSLVDLIAAAGPEATAPASFGEATGAPDDELAAATLAVIASLADTTELPSGSGLRELVDELAATAALPALPDAPGPLDELAATAALPALLDAPGLHEAHAAHEVPSATGYPTPGTGAPVSRPPTGPVPHAIATPVSRPPTGPVPHAVATPAAAYPPTVRVRTSPVGRAKRRTQSWLAGIITLGVVGGSATTAIVMMRHGDPPANVVPGAAAPAADHPAGDPAVASPPPSNPSPDVATPAADHPAGAPVTPTAGAPNTPTAGDQATPTPVPTVPGHAVTPALVDAASADGAQSGSALAAKKHHGHHHVQPTADAKAAPAPADAHDPAAATQPSTPTSAPANVEWKPTLLLPTDGSGARNPK